MPSPAVAVVATTVLPASSSSTVTPLAPASPASWTPSPLVSIQIRSPIEPEAAPR
jgi:hypothetical protein